jgi:hypothetical protein
MLPWHRIVGAADRYDRSKIDILLLKQSCLKNTCASSCFCGWCGGPGKCTSQAKCEKLWHGKPGWVNSDWNKLAYAMVILLSTFGTILVVATLVGCALRKVRCQVLMTFQKPPKKIQPALRPTPFGGGRGSFSTFNPVMVQPGGFTASEMEEGTGGGDFDGGGGGMERGRGVSADGRPGSVGGDTLITLPILNVGGSSPAAPRALPQVLSPSGHAKDGGMASEPRAADITVPVEVATAAKLSLSDAVVAEVAAGRFFTPGKASVKGAEGGANADSNADANAEVNGGDDEAPMECPVGGEACGGEAEFVCSRCGKQGCVVRRVNTACLVLFVWSFGLLISLFFLSFVCFEFSYGCSLVRLFTCPILFCLFGCSLFVK